MSSRFEVVAPPLVACEHTLTSISGLRAAGVSANIKASGLPDVALLVSDAPMSVGAVFTQNKFASPSVVVSRKHLEKSAGLARAVVAVSGNANACTGDEGLGNARAMADHAARLVGCPSEQILVCTTGVIGVQLPMDRVHSGIDAAFAALASDLEAGRRFHRAIMTTDAFPKEASESSEGLIAAGICKGAGMIAPNMATMLAFVATDIALSQAEIQRMMPKIADASFNGVHVDSHPSTNDTFMVLSLPAASQPKVDAQSILTRVAKRLAWLIARDGEGATKVTTIVIRGAQNEQAAKTIARDIATSALVRTAIFGNDPNWGRFVSQVGNSHAVNSVFGLRCWIAGHLVFEHGQPAKFDRQVVSKAMQQESIELVIELTEGSGSYELMTADLGYRYIEINAEYTT